MKSSITRIGLGIVCAIVLNVGPLAASGRAGLIPWMYESVFGTGGYGYGAGYAPAESYGYGGGYGYGAGYGYAAGYGGGYGGGCCLSRLFGGCGLFGCGRPAYAGYAPSYYAPNNNYAPSYGNPGCGPCGNSSAYSLSGLCCNNGCSGLGCASGDCSSGDCSSGDCLSDGGDTVMPYNGSPIPTPDNSRPSDFSNSSTQPDPAQIPKTYKEPDPNDPFMEPRQSPGTGQGGFEPAGGSAGEPQGGNTDSIMPSTDGPETSPTNPGRDIQRGEEPQFNFKIPARNRPALPADSDESHIARPLNFATQIVSHALPQRSRSLYRAVFRTPSVTRADVPSRSDWEPINETKLATAR